MCKTITQSLVLAQACLLLFIMPLLCHYYVIVVSFLCHYYVSCHYYVHYHHRLSSTLALLCSGDGGELHLPADENIEQRRLELHVLWSIPPFS
jgi:hypothetical protein